MVDKKSNKDLNEIFDTSERFNNEKTESEDDPLDVGSDYKPSVQSEYSDFDDLLEVDKSRVTENIKQSVSLKKVVTNEDSGKNKVESKPSFDDDDFFASDGDKKKVVQKEVVKEVVKEPVKKDVGSPIIEMIYDKEQWSLTTENPLYQKFYQHKNNVVCKLLQSEKELDFPTLKKELYESTITVGTSISTRDFEEINQRMQKIQKWKDRVCEIGIMVNNQYYPWKRFLTLLTGLLAKVEYDKPAVKQDGLIYLHLKDMESYCAELDAIHDNVFMVMKNLDSAYDTLSRHLTLAMYEFGATKERNVYKS